MATMMRYGLLTGGILALLLLTTTTGRAADPAPGTASSFRVDGARSTPASSGEAVVPIARRGATTPDARDLLTIAALFCLLIAGIILNTKTSASTSREDVASARGASGLHVQGGGETAASSHGPESVSP